MLEEFWHAILKCISLTAKNKMESIQHSPAASAITSALNAIEQQTHTVATAEDRNRIEKRQAFFALLDRNAPALFNAVAEAAKNNKRHVHVAQSPNFNAEANALFGQVFGRFDTELVQDWLRARDLAHVFRADVYTIRW